MAATATIPGAGALLLLVVYGLIPQLVVGAPNTSGDHVTKRSTKCYAEIGCFSNTGAFAGAQRPLTVTPASPDVIKTRFYLYTREDRTSGPQVDARNIAADVSTNWANFKYSRPTLLIIHGFLDNPAIVKWMKDMKEELLVHDDYNVIIVDWSSGNLPPYTQATANTRVVGAQIALLLSRLISLGAEASNFHLIGHSLGAHTAGYAGERTPGLGRITGLDPAGPYFEGTDVTVRLDPSDALFVDVIHTDADPLLQLGFGLKQQLGHMDFYPNLGHDQPSCQTDPIGELIHNDFYTGVSEIAACSHLRSYKFFTESINSNCPFLAFPCASEEDFAANKCHSCQSPGCAFMGMHSFETRHPSGQNAKYFLTTGGDSPFCQYHMKITVKLTPGDKWAAERGELAIVVQGSDSFSPKIVLNSSPINWVPGSVHTFYVGVPTDVGDVKWVSVFWDHRPTLLDPLHWNILGARHPSISISEVDILNEETGNSISLCGGPQELETGKRLTISTQCTTTAI